jgi:hypothetical protein
VARKPKIYFQTRPPSAHELLSQLQAIFPEFGEEVLEDFELRKEAGILEDPEKPVGLHAVMMHFSCHGWPADDPELANRQLKALGELLSEAVAVDDLFENAVSTCLLEHLGQIERYWMLAPYLSPLAKRKCRA